MRPLAFFPLVCALITLVLTMLSIFAGSKPGFLQDSDILTLNTSRLGQMSLSKPAPESESSSPLNRLTESIAETAEDVGNEVVDKLTDKLGVKDFYSAHVLTYCEGAYQPDPTDPNASKNVTHCSERKALYMFDPKDIMAKELVGGVSLEDLKWPDALDDGIRSLRAALKAMFIAYVVGIAVTGLTIITSAIGVADIGSLTAVINLVLCSLSFLALCLASIIVTAASTKAAAAITQHGESIGIVATTGAQFLAFTWSATMLMLLAGCVWIFIFLKSRSSKSGTYPKNGF